MMLINNDKVSITTFEKKHQQQVIDLIIGVQSGEFGVQITAADQPDLSHINDYYQRANGQFWLAVMADQVIGTIALSDIGHQQVALRKMFVKKDFRGQPLNIGQRLMETSVRWCQCKKVTDIFLGTVPSYHAAHRFYEKNDFSQIHRNKLPETFSIMAVDKLFYHLKVT